MMYPLEMFYPYPTKTFLFVASKKALVTNLPPTVFLEGSYMGKTRFAPTTPDLFHPLRLISLYAEAQEGEI